MEKRNTLEYLKQAIDEAIYTYGHCLIGDIDKAEMAEDLERWLEASVDISNKLDDALYNYIIRKESRCKQMTYYEFMTMLRENITHYELSDDRCLTITHPYTGKSITLDFNLLDEDMFEQLAVEEDTQ